MRKTKRIGCISVCVFVFFEILVHLLFLPICYLLFLALICNSKFFYMFYVFEIVFIERRCLFIVVQWPRINIFIFYLPV